MKNIYGILLIRSLLDCPINTKLKLHSNMTKSVCLRKVKDEQIM